MFERLGSFLLLFLSVFCLTGPSMGSEGFYSGIEHFNAKRFAEAKKSFEMALDENPGDVGIMLNLGLAHQALNENAHAVAYFRRARDLGSSEGLAALEYLRSRGIGNPPTGTEPSMLAKIAVLSLRVPGSLFVVVTPLLFFLMGWLILVYLKALKSGESQRARLSAWVYPIGTLWLFFLGLFLLQMSYQATKRVTLIVDKTSARAAPKADAPALFELTSAAELEVNDLAQDWIQVRTLDGEIGWIKIEEVLISKAFPL